MQLSLFEHVEAAFRESPGPMTTTELYSRVSRLAGIPGTRVNETTAIGKSGQRHSLIKRQIRWHQQTLKSKGIIERSGDGRWDLTKTGKIQLRKIQPQCSMVAFSTELGAALWSLSDDVFSELDTPITLCLTSPPYPLRRAGPMATLISMNTLNSWWRACAESLETWSPADPSASTFPMTFLNRGGRPHDLYTGNA